MGRYQYETSPRKIEPDYRVNEKKKKSQQNDKKQIKKQAQQKAKIRNHIRIKRKRLVVGIALAFITLLAISYRNSLINVSFSKVKSLRNDLAAIEKENEQLQVNIESSINLQNVKQMAEEQLGMQKLLPEQKIYITLPKNDYVEPASEGIEIEKSKSILQKIIDFIKGE